MTLHDFEHSQRIEQQWVPMLDNGLLEGGYSLRLATMEEQWRGMDRIVTAENGARHQVEYKCCEQWQKYGNVFLETVSNATTGRPGCVLTSEAEWFLYFLTPERVLVFWMLALRAQMPTWRTQYPEKAAANIKHGRLYDTLGLCVPMAVAERIAESVSWLSRGDCIVLERDQRLNF